MSAETPTAAKRPSADQLLCQVAAGDQAAFALLYEDTCTRIHGLIRRVLVDASQSEEVTQEAYLEVWQHADRYDPASGSTIAWILSIAHRHAIDRVRASQSSTMRGLRVDTGDRVDSFDEVPAEVGTRVEHERATRCFELLTPIQREALALAYWAGLTANEIAARLCVSVATAKSLLRDGLIRLRIEMDNEDRPESPSGLHDHDRRRMRTGMRKQ